MGLCETDENHPVLGNSKQALETLVQQRLELPDESICSAFICRSYLFYIDSKHLSLALFPFYQGICRRTGLMAPKVILCFMSSLREL